MSLCPQTLLNVINGIYYYQFIDCSNPSSSFTCQTDHPLTCGCDPGNTDCTSGSIPGPTGPGGSTSLSALSTTRELIVSELTTSKNSKSAKNRKKANVPDDGDAHLVHASVATVGLAAPLKAEAPWSFARASFDPAFEGDAAYHVVTIGGTKRFIRVVQAAIKPNPSLFHLSFDGTAPRLHPLPEVNLRIGQETLLPDGVKPRPMTVQGTTYGPCYQRLARSGAKANRTVFHVLLKG